MWELNAPPLLLAVDHQPHIAADVGMIPAAAVVAAVGVAKHTDCCCLGDPSVVAAAAIPGVDTAA